jgi:hypothetical protein
MEANKEGDGDQKQPQGDATQKPPEAPKAEKGQDLEAKPSGDKAGKGGGDQPPPDPPPPIVINLPPPQRDGLSVTDWITAISTLIIMFWAGLQWWEMHMGGADTAAIRVAAQQQAIAAQQFATSAGNINSGIATAVQKLNLQADKLEKSAEQTSRLAKTAEEANANAMQSDRPWFGAVLTVDGFEKDKMPIATIYFTNSGKRPARILVAEAHTGWFSVFPDNPPYEPLGNVSRGVVVPGTPLINKFNMARIPLSESEISTADTGNPASYFLYANLEYIDMRMGQHHHAHFCWRYIGNVPQLPKGFYGCEGYDDAD